MYLLETFICCKANLIGFKGDYSNILGVQTFKTSTVLLHGTFRILRLFTVKPAGV